MSDAYNYSDLKSILDEFRKEHICPCCQEIVKIPVTPKTVWTHLQVQSCGHIFCLKCLRSWWESQRNAGLQLNCPTCRASIFNKNNSQSLASKMRILPRHESERYDILNKLEHPNGFDCQNYCGKKFTSSSAYHDHLRQDCPKSLIPCIGPDSEHGCTIRFKGPRDEMVENRCLKCARLNYTNRVSVMEQFERQVIEQQTRFQEMKKKLESVKDELERKENKHRR